LNPCLFYAFGYEPLPMGLSGDRASFDHRTKHEAFKSKTPRLFK
jgi:hypothetical protein